MKKQSSKQNVNLKNKVKDKANPKVVVNAQNRRLSQLMSKKYSVIIENNIN